MNSIFCAVLAALSIWEYPQRQQRHEILSKEFISAVSAGDSAAMETFSREGATLLPDDPTWRYNYACALARNGKKEEALDTLEKAVRLGYRDTVGIGNDRDLASLAGNPRFEEILELSDRLASQPILSGPHAGIPARGSAGRTLVLGSQNLSWNYDIGAFEAKMVLSGLEGGGNRGDLYFNRDAGHSQPDVSEFPGLTKVVLEREGRAKGVDLDFPNIAFPYPVFGNCSRALVSGPMWRSLPRALMTAEAWRMKAAYAFYRSNQVWVFPAVYDCPPAGTNGDVFASVSPYWIQTQGKSWSDLPYLKAALEVSRSLKPDVKGYIVEHGLLAPTVQTLVRKALKTVSGEEDYLTSKAHPTAFPANGIDVERLKKAAAGLTVEQVPPVATVLGVSSAGTENVPPRPELTYMTPCASAFVLRCPDAKRVFTLAAGGADAYEFRIVHGREGAASIKRMSPNVVKVFLDKSKIDPANRVDLAVFGKSASSQWGAPAFVSFAVVDKSAKYADPLLIDKDDAGNGESSGSPQEK